MDYQPELFERKCYCGKNPDPHPDECDHVRSCNGWTIGFCHGFCAEAFDRNIVREPERQLQLVEARHE